VSELGAPRVSVIVAAHNRPRLLTEAVASVRRQTYPVFETIVVDDGSTPALDLGELQAAGGAILRIVRHEVPKRTAGAKNAGIQSAQGDIITFLDDDDLLAPSYVETAVRAFQKHPEQQVLFMGVSWFGRLGPQGEKAYREGMAKILNAMEARAVEPGGPLLLGEALYPALLQRVPMAFQRTAVRRNAFTQVGMYREGCALQDCDWAVRAARLVPCALCSDGLYLQRTEGQGAFSRPERKEQHGHARIEMYEYLLGQAAIAPTRPDEVGLLRRSLATAWFDLAYHHVDTARPLEAAKALLRSQRAHHVVRRWKLAIRLAKAMIGLGRVPDGARSSSR
jgi:GT2 family glycosyltransferase